MKQTDVVIIGAGPVGLFTIFQCGMLGMKCHVVDVLPFAGGQCQALYPEKPIYDIPAYPVITGSDLTQKLKQQADAFSPVYHLEQQVASLVKDENGTFILTTSSGTHIHSKAVIVAAGGGAFVPQRPPLKGIDMFEGKSVFYSVQQKALFKDKHLVIAGGGDSAVDWAVDLAPIAGSVSLVHRRDNFKASPEMLSRLQALVDSGQVKKLTPWQLAGLTGENGQLTSVEIRGNDGEIQSLQADALLPFFGLSTSLGAIATWGFTFDRGSISVTPSTMETNWKGVYAVGDVAHYDGKLKLILMGFSESAMACHSAYSYVFPDKALHFEHSTSKGIGAS